MTTHTDSSSYAFELVPPDCPYAALRRSFGRWLDRLGATAPAIDDWTLVVSELAANACAHSASGIPVEICAQLSEARMEVTVSNATFGQAPIPRRDMPDLLATRGRGLPIVRELVEQLEIDVGDRGVTVSCSGVLPFTPPPG